MFSVHCPRHDAQILLSERHIESIEQCAAGVLAVHWRCWCGERGSQVTGRIGPSTRHLVA